MICAIRDLTAGVFKNLEIISNMDVDKNIKYTQNILRVKELNKYKQVLYE